MVLLPVVVGVALNRGVARIVMASFLFIVSWAIAGVVGTVMSGS